MALTDYKITDSDISTHGLVSAPDKLQDTAQNNKRRFDQLIREAIKAKFNGLIDALAAAVADKLPWPKINGEPDYGADGEYLMTDGEGGISWGTAPGGGDMLASAYATNGAPGVVDKAASCTGNAATATRLEGGLVIGKLYLDSSCYGDELPTDDYTEGRIFFLRVGD